MQDYINDDGCRLLAAAVVKKAIEDYTNALKRIRRKPNSISASRMINDCEKFFKNEIALYSDLDGFAVMRAVKERIDKEA